MADPAILAVAAQQMLDRDVRFHAEAGFAHRSHEAQSANAIGEGHATRGEQPGEQPEWSCKP
jgi:hypothetical protein